MCIRDRRDQGDQREHEKNEVEFGDGQRHDGRFRFADRRVSVSYTHLRAHETVLDIVCRLLLEKKKTIIISEYIHINVEKHISMIYK